jgi:hypothetical protein
MEHRDLIFTSDAVICLSSSRGFVTHRLSLRKAAQRARITFKISLLNGTEKSPTADVYAGDTSSLNAADASNGSIYFFDIEADTEPGTFARIANVLNIANIAPKRVILELKETDGSLSIHIELKVGLHTAQSIQRKLTPS